MLKTFHYIPNLNPSEFSHDYLSTTVALALFLIVLIATCQSTFMHHIDLDMDHCPGQLSSKEIMKIFKTDFF